MFFQKEEMTFQIINVLLLDQTNINHSGSGRDYHAISMRYDAEGYFIISGQKYDLKSNIVSFLPSHLDYMRKAKKDKYIAVDFVSDDNSFTDFESFCPSSPLALLEKFEELYKVWTEKSSGYKFKSAGIFNQILEYCHVQHCVTTQSDSIIKNSVSYLMAHYTSPDLSISEIAKQSYMSEVYFRKLFKKQFGTSPQKYVIRLRIQKATELLKTGYYSLKEVALLCGYRDYQYFFVQFREQMGCKPSDFQ